MIRLFFLFIITIFPTFLLAQLQEDFSDGELLSNPTWQGDISNFNVNENFELQLAAPAAGSSQLFTQVDLPDSTIWEISIRLDFSPSTSNLLQVFLQLDSDDLTTSNGYFLEIGESGSEDAIKIYRKDGSSNQLLANGTVGAVGTEPVTANVKLTRTKTGDWTLLVDYSGGRNFVAEASFSDNTYQGGTSQYFGFKCNYTASRTDKFFFDDITIASLIPDREAPQLVNVIANSSNTLEVYFDEPVSTASAELLSNYMIPGIGQASLAEQDGSNKLLVELTFSGAQFVSGQNYSLEVRNVEDLLGNAMDVESLNFIYINIQEAEAYDILINEFMADPTPVLGLPSAEFVELYNRSDKIINLKDYKLSRGGIQSAIFTSFSARTRRLCNCV